MKSKLVEILAYSHLPIQRSAKVFVSGCEKFVPALAYLFCLALRGSYLVGFADVLAGLCKDFAELYTEIG